MAYTRKQILGRLRKHIANGIPIIGGGAGNGISAKCQEIGGVDLLVIYNSGRFRMNGRGSLAGCMPLCKYILIHKCMATYEILNNRNPSVYMP